MQEASELIAVFAGERERALELSLVLDARGIAHEVAYRGGGQWAIEVSTAAADVARAEFERYADEAIRRIPLPPAPTVFPGAWLGAVGFAGVVLAVGFLAGRGALQADWFARGSLQHSVFAAGEWWRCVTALTLHADQSHAMGNLLFGIGFGVLAGRVFGAGVAWGCIVAAAALANAVDIAIAPPGFRAIGASTAVFAALGLLTGFAWQTRFAHLGPRERLLRRSTPVLAGMGLLILLGDGAEHVDVIGHLCGFTSGTVVGWWLSRARLPRGRSAVLQWCCGGAALMLVTAAWIAALGLRSMP